MSHGRMVEKELNQTADLDQRLLLGCTSPAREQTLPEAPQIGVGAVACGADTDPRPW
jgi:hypothetical protein